MDGLDDLVKRQVALWKLHDKAESHKQRKAIEDQIKSLEKQKPHATIILTK